MKSKKFPLGVTVHVMRFGRASPFYQRLYTGWVTNSDGIKVGFEVGLSGRHLIVSRGGVYH